MTKRFLLCLVLAGLSACSIPATDIGPNPFAGCYDDTCVGAPVHVTNVPAFTSVVADAQNTCALSADGEAWCWGLNEGGIVGDGTTENRSRPVRVAGEVRFKELSLGAMTACGISTDNHAYCWGQDAAGALGNGGTDSCVSHGVALKCAKSPQLVPDRAYTKIAVGTRHVCALDTDGAPWCWGFNYAGEAGSSVVGETIAAPRQVNTTQRFTQIIAGDLHTCALTQQGQVWCWGHNDRGELGRSTGTCETVFPTYCSPTPVAAQTTERFTSISTQSGHVCALNAAGAAFCWGDNGQTQIATSGAADLVLTPMRSQPTMTFSVIDASSAVTCGTPTSGPTVCWGLNNMGKLGVGSRIELSGTPLVVAGDRRYVALAGAPLHMCGLTADGALWCWGSNRFGQLGTG